MADLSNYVPGGSHTYSRGRDQFPDNCPKLINYAKECYVYDINNNKYIDFNMGLRCNILGYNNDIINNSAIEEIKKGNGFVLPSYSEYELAKKICELLEYDMVKFAKNGSNVNTAAVKLARAFTGKKYILRCKNNPFLSFDDWFIGDTCIKKGTLNEINKFTINFEYNNIEELEQIVKENNDISCIILEPCTVEIPKIYSDGLNFLQKIRQICDDNNIVFILDEVITGFRYHLKGAQYIFNVKPHLSTFGKACANGFSFAFLVGKREIMNLGGINNQGQERVFLLSSTFGAEMSSIGAASKTIDFIFENDVISQIWNNGKYLITFFNNIAKSLNIDKYIYMYGFDCSPYLETKNNQLKSCLIYRTLFLEKLMEKNIIMNCITISIYHTPELIDSLYTSFKYSLEIYKKAIDYNNPYQFLKSTNIIKPVFRQYN